MIAAEEEEWVARNRKDGDAKGSGGAGGNATMGSFEEYREKSKAAGVI